MSWCYVLMSQSAPVAPVFVSPPPFEVVYTDEVEADEPVTVHKAVEDKLRRGPWQPEG